MDSAERRPARNPDGKRPISPLIAIARVAAPDCRAARHLHAVDACDGRPSPATARDVVRVLIRGLNSGSRHRSVFFAPEAAELSFDERWLDAPAAACRDGDAASRRFLSARRCRPGAPAAIVSLAPAVAGPLADLEWFQHSPACRRAPASPSPYEESRTWPRPHSP